MHVFPFLGLMEPLRPDLPGPAGPIHRRGKFKANARRQKGRKVLPRRRA